MSLADATDFLGAPDAERLISRAWRRGAARLRGVRPGESHPVEIPSSEEGEIDCVDSRIGEGVLLTTYQTVTIAWDDVRRLTQPSTRDGASDADILEAEAGPLVKAVALELLRQFPEGRPRGWTRDKLMHCVHDKSEGGIDLFSPATLDRAVALAWPRAKPARVPKAAKPPS